MPGRRPPAATGPIDPNLCRRCQENEPAITVRNDPICKTCFYRYVSTKVVKRMESFRVRNSEPGAEPTILLPNSFGCCSISLFHILHEQWKRQIERTGRPGYKLHLLHVNDGIDITAQLEEIKARYPEHSYSVIPFSDVASLPEVTHLFPTTDNTTPDLTSILASLPSATSRTDVTQILLRKLVVNFAHQNAFEAILWADSTTRLAERTIAETAKGRGSSLPLIMSDGNKTHQTVPFYYPLRELLHKELASYAALQSPPLTDMVRVEDTRPAVSTKNTTIDELMRQYFEGVERDFPAIVANVVRTTSKLEMGVLDGAKGVCELCDMPLVGGVAPQRSRLCYGCIRTLPQAAESVES